MLSVQFKRNKRINDARVQPHIAHHFFFHDSAFNVQLKITEKKTKHKQMRTFLLV